MTYGIPLLLLAAGASPALAREPARTPASVAALAASSETFDHRIEPGDTLIGLHRRLMRPEADWRVVQRLNRVADPRRLQPGRTLRIPVSFLQGEPVAAEVVHLHGSVTVRRGGGEPVPLTPTAALQEGDVVETGAQSSLSIRFVDGALTLVGPASRLQVARHRRLPHAGGAAASRPDADTRLQLQQGAAEAEVPVPGSPGEARPPRFELRTPVVNFGVRGTRFRARVDGQTTWGEVERGTVAFGSLLLAPGQGARAAPGVTPSPRALLPAPSSEGLPALLERVPLNWAWAEAPGATGWRAQILAPDANAPAPAIDRLLVEQRLTRPSLTVTDLPDGPYELRLRAIDAEGLEGRERRVPFVLKARPEPPLMLAPAAASEWTTPSVAFAWSRHPEGERYRIEIVAVGDDGRETPVLARDDLVDTRLDVPLPPGQYRWRLGTVRTGDDRGPWGDPQAFVRKPPPPPPPAPPADPPRADRDGLQLRWSASALPGARYQVQVARDEAFGAPVADETLDATAWRLASPQPGTYHVRVRTIDTLGQAGPWGTAQTVEVPRSWEWWWLLPLLLLI